MSESFQIYLTITPFDNLLIGKLHIIRGKRITAISLVRNALSWGDYHYFHNNIFGRHHYFYELEYAFEGQSYCFICVFESEIKVCFIWDTNIATLFSLRILTSDIFASKDSTNNLPLYLTVAGTVFYFLAPFSIVLCLYLRWPLSLFIQLSLLLFIFFFVFLPYSPLCSVSTSGGHFHFLFNFLF